MFGYRCQCCGHFWASQAHPDHNAIITTLCPVCIPKVLPVVTLGEPARRAS